MSNHQNIYSQRGCVNCKPCEGGGANIGRKWTLIAIGFCTAGLGLLFLPFFKKCQYCTHNTWWNKHYGPDMRRSAQQSASAAPTLSQQ